MFSRIFGDSPEKITKEERRLLYVALTRAVETLVILTDGGNKSPFLEDLERRQPPSEINWADYPPIHCTLTRLVVKVGNQDGRGGASTFSIKDFLKAAGYQWQPTGRPVWEKSFPAEGFSLETLKSVVWAKSADGIEVRICDDTERLVAHYLIDNGNWRCMVNKLATLREADKSKEKPQNE